MKIVLRLVSLVAIAVIGFWLWTVFFPSAEKVILKKISNLAATATFSPADGNLSRASKVSNLIGFFSTDAEIRVDMSELGAHTLSGRDEIRDAARGGFASLATLNVQFLDVSVRVGADKSSADVSCTGRIHASDKKDYAVLELHFQFKKIDGDWLITRIETIKTLS